MEFTDEAVNKINNNKKSKNNIYTNLKYKQMMLCVSNNKTRLFLSKFSILCATLIFVVMATDIVAPSLIRPKKVSDFSTKNITETKIDYFNRIGKTQKQIYVSNFTDIATDVAKFVPVVVSIILKNPIIYISYSGAYAVETLFGSLLRVIVKSPRPDDANNRTSFPSGHAIYICSVAMIMSIMLGRLKCCIPLFAFALFVVNAPTSR